jgi:MFS family permease
MRDNELVPTERDRDATLVTGTREALAWIRSDISARVVLLTIAVLSFVGFNFHVLVPLLASDTLSVGPEGLGLLSAAFGLGALAGALSAASSGSAGTARFLTATAVFGGLLLLLSVSKGVAMAAPVLVALGAAFALLTTSANSLVQLAAPDRLRGRVIALYLFAFAGLTPVGGLVAGALAERGGTGLAFGFGGLVALVVAAAGWVSLRRGLGACSAEPELQSITQVSPPAISETSSPSPLRSRASAT